MSAQLRTGCNKPGCKEGENEADENRWQNPLSDWVWAIGLSTNRIPATGLKLVSSRLTGNLPRHLSTNRIPATGLKPFYRLLIVGFVNLSTNRIPATGLKHSSEPTSCQRSGLSTNRIPAT